MKATNVIVTIIGLAIVGFLGYYLYTSLGQIGPEENYEFTQGEPIVDDYQEEVVYTETVLDFETEEELDAQINAQESQETQADEDLESLESLDF
ncbi:hypothetical protein KC929_01015 [Patescibacteria group bacterium]|nr:hypothetical protein [Patescibacteria group bacterium]